MANTRTLTPQKAEITGSPNQAYRLVRWSATVIMDRLRSIQSLPAEKYGKSSSQLRAQFVYLAGVLIGAGEGHFTDAEIEGLLERHRPPWVDRRDYLYQWHRALKQARDPKNPYKITPQWPDDRPLPEQYKRPPAPVTTEETAKDDHLTYNYLVAKGYIDDPAAAGELARELWPAGDPIMTAAIAYFDGEYPGEPDTEKTCGVKWLNTIYQGQGNNIDVVAQRAHIPVLHGYTSKHGQVIAPCPHCIHEEAIKISQKLEKAAEHYTSKNLPIRYLETTETEASKYRLRINQRNQRSKDGVLYNKARIPQENDHCIFFHDAPDIEGTPLPADRGELYALAYTWVMYRPKGKRGSHGLATWGNQTVNGKEKKQGGGGQRRKRLFRIFGDDYGKYMTLLEAFLGEEINGKKHEFTVDMDVYFKWLNDTGLDYVILEASPDVSNKLYAQDDIYLTGDKDPPRERKEPPQKRWTQDKAGLGEPVKSVKEV